jgi:ribosome-binding factor A
MQLKFEKKILNALEIVMQTENKDQRLIDVNFIDINVNKDLLHTQIKWDHNNSNLNSIEKEKINEILQKAAPFFSSKITKISQLRFAPRIHFYY